MTEIIGTLYQMEGVAKVFRYISEFALEKFYQENLSPNCHQEFAEFVSEKSDLKENLFTNCHQESAADRALSIFNTLDFDGLKSHMLFPL